MMVSTTVYEWKIELLDERGDSVGEVAHFDSYADACAHALRHVGRIDIALVLHSYGPGEALIDRQRAYLSAKRALPATFEYGADIPKRFREEVREEADRLAAIRAAAEAVAKRAAEEEAAAKAAAKAEAAAKLEAQKAARLARKLAAEIEAARIADARTAEVIAARDERMAKHITPLEAKPEPKKRVKNTAPTSEKPA